MTEKFRRVSKKVGEFSVGITRSELADMMTLGDEEENRKRLEKAGGIEGIFSKVSSSKDFGLSNFESKDHYGPRKAKLGSNRVEESLPKTFMQLFLSSFEDETIRILIISATSRNIDRANPPRPTLTSTGELTPNVPIPKLIGNLFPDTPFTK